MRCYQGFTKFYLVIANVLFGFFGGALIAFGVMGIHHHIEEASIILPLGILKMINVLGVMICIISLIGIVGALYQERVVVHIVYTFIVLAALVYQIITASIVYNQAAHSSSWLSKAWSESSPEYRIHVQTRFSCCGFSHAHDYSVHTPTCDPDDTVNSARPCYGPITHFIRHNLQIIYIVLFAALSIELLALCNVSAVLCSRYSNRRQQQSHEPKDDGGCDILTPQVVQSFGQHNSKKEQQLKAPMAMMYSEKGADKPQQDPLDDCFKEKEANKYSGAYWQPNT